MRKFFASLIALLALTAPATAQQTKAQLNTEVAANFPDNTTGLITPAILRTTVNDFIASWQQAPRVNAQTGTTYAIVIGDYGYLITFSNTSPVAVSLPQATSSFATFNFMVCNRNTGAVTITPATSTINGASTLVLQQNQCSSVIADGANYQVLSSNVQPLACAASNWINAINAAGIPQCAQPAFTDISGTLQPNKGGTGSTSIPSSAQIMIGTGTVYVPQSITGDASVTAGGVWTNSKVNGVSYPASPSLNTVAVVTSTNQTTYQAVPNVALANSSITLNAGTNVGLTTPGAMALGTVNVIGSTSDTPRFAGLGLGCASSGANFLTLCGSSSGKVDMRVPAVAGSNTITWPAGTTDFSATGGASQVVKQVTLGAGFTVAQLAFTDISGTLAAAQVATTTITGQTINNSPSASNDYLMYFSAADNAVRRCTVGACTAAATAGVSSLNGLTGGLSIVSGTGIAVSAGGTSVTVALSSGRQTNPTTQSLTSGTSATYTTPANALWLEVFYCGGGGGGAGAKTGDSTNFAVAGSNGGTTTFNSINAAGGSGGAAATGTGISRGGAGGTGGTGSATRRQAGSGGHPATGRSNTTLATAGGNGGVGYFGGAGRAAGDSGVGEAAAANSCSGGGGAVNNGGANFNSAAGGGAGEFVFLLITSPSATYTYTVGASGAGGTSDFNGGNGGSGFIFVVEHYN